MVEENISNFYKINLENKAAKVKIVKIILILILQAQAKDFLL